MLLAAGRLASLHEELMMNLFPRSAKVLTVDDWIASLPAPIRR
jgi:hypothetical protein